MEIIKYCDSESIKRIEGRSSLDYLLAIEQQVNLFNLKKEKQIAKKARIIAIEGLNCCGKTTQKYLLEEKFKKAGYNSFVTPTYKTPCWKIMSKIGKGTFYINQPVEDTIIWATHFIDQARDIKKELETKDFVIFDRYKDNFKFIQQAILEFHKINFSTRWLEDLIYELPDPEQTIFLDIPIKEMKERYKKRGGRISLEGKDLEISERARELFISKYNSCKSKIIDGTLNQSEISDIIYKKIILKEVETNEKERNSVHNRQ